MYKHLSMKSSIVLFLAIMVLSSDVYAQQLHRSLISSSGAYYRGQDFHISFSVGEPVSFHRRVGESFWNFGFQQGYDDLLNSAVTTIGPAGFSLKIYPNPLPQDGILYGKGPSENLKGRHQWYIINLQGQMLATGVLDPINAEQVLINSNLLRERGLMWFILEGENKILQRTPFIRL